jgi:hypothetical protein
MAFLLLAALLLCTGLVVVFWSRHVVLRREAYIRAVELPMGLFDRLQKQHPTLSAKDCQLVAHGLRQFFLAHLKSGRAYVSMPSQVADDLWHEFILHTRTYDAFCRKAFGRFLHHTPAAALRGNRQSNAGLRRCWWYVCKEENINPRKATRLPLLFALDAKLHITGGFYYLADCVLARQKEDGASGSSSIYCGGDFADASMDGSLDGFGDGSTGGAAADASGSDGCGGGGCGGDGG